MKPIHLISTSLFVGIFLMSGNLHAQDPTVVAPNVYKKIVLENDKVRIIELELPAGETIPWHSHPNHVAYALTDAKIEITDKGKLPVVADIKAGEALYIPAVTHMAKNIGAASARLVVTELKPAIPKKLKSKSITALKK
jgi:quercetin dioxygenase-like cupin family protein